MKMLWAMVLMTLSFAVMVAGARIENRTVTVERVMAIPPEVPTIEIAGGREAVGEGDAGRLTFDPTTRELQARGVLPRYVVNALLERTVKHDFKDQIDSLEGETRQASEAVPARVTLSSAPGSYALPFSPPEARERGITWDAPTRTMTFTKWVDTPTRADLVSAGAPSEWRDPLLSLERRSNAARVSGVWLLLSYFFATLGELCLSPVGLSMVTKLAPLRFASLFMGVWLLSSSVAQYAGGSIGETWGIVPPARYFMLFVWTSVAGAVALAALVRPLRRLMHEVR
jgi:POT family proton-dependent oligopeptide transporter